MIELRLKDVRFRLKDVRESRGLTQEALAEITKISVQNIRKIEQGKSRGVRWITLILLCEILECGVCDLIVIVSEGNEDA